MESVHASADSLGEWLRHAREARGRTLDSIANETRIPRRYLEALEHDDLGAAPGGFYQRAEIRAYARAVGIDQERALARLDAELKAEDVAIPPPQVAPVRQESGSTRTYMALVVGIAVVAAALAGRFTSKETSPANAPAVLEARAPEPAAAARAKAATALTPETATPVVLPGNPAEDVSQVGAPESASPQVPTESSAPVEPPAAATTGLVVTTQPAGALVTVNGIGWGPSPVTIRYLPSGDKRIRVSKEGFVAEERVLRVSEDQRQELDIPLTVAAP